MITFILILFLTFSSGQSLDICTSKGVLKPKLNFFTATDYSQLVAINFKPLIDSSNYIKETIKTLDSSLEPFDTKTEINNLNKAHLITFDSERSLYYHKHTSSTRKFCMEHGGKPFVPRNYADVSRLSELIKIIDALEITVIDVINDNGTITSRNGDILFESTATDSDYFYLTFSKSNLSNPSLIQQQSITYPFGVWCELVRTPFSMADLSYNAESWLEEIRHFRENKNDFLNGLLKLMRNMDEIPSGGIYDEATYTLLLPDEMVKAEEILRRTVGSGSIEYYTVEQIQNLKALNQLLRTLADVFYSSFLFNGNILVINFEMLKVSQLSRNMSVTEFEVNRKNNQVLKGTIRGKVLDEMSIVYLSVPYLLEPDSIMDTYIIKTKKDSWTTSFPFEVIHKCKTSQGRNICEVNALAKDAKSQECAKFLLGEIQHNECKITGSYVNNAPRAIRTNCKGKTIVQISFFKPFIVDIVCKTNVIGTRTFEMGLTEIETDCGLYFEGDQILDDLSQLSGDGFNVVGTFQDIIPDDFQYSIIPGLANSKFYKYLTYAASSLAALFLIGLILKCTLFKRYACCPCWMRLIECYDSCNHRNFLPVRNQNVNRNNQRLSARYNAQERVTFIR